MATYSAHVDTFVGDNLPPREAWPELIFELPELHYPEHLNAAGALLDGVATGEGGGRPCVHTEDRVWSYRELLERANRIARVLVEDMGLVPGNRVLLRAANTPMLIASWFGVLKAGGVAVATMPLLRAVELTTIIGKAQISHALADARMVEELEAARREEAAVLSKLMTFGPGGELEERMETKPPDFETVETAAEDVALIAFTSGTTGDPKGCMHFHRDILAVCDTFARRLLDPQPDEVFTGTPPLAFLRVGWFGVVSDALWSLDRAYRAAGTGVTSGSYRDLSGYHGLHRADRLPRAARQLRRGRPLFSQEVRVGRREPAACDVRRLV